MTYRLLTLCKVIDKRLWGFAHPLRQFSNLSHVVLNRLEEKKLTVDKLKEMRKDEIGMTAFKLNSFGGVFPCQQLNFRECALCSSIPAHFNY